MSTHVLHPEGATVSMSDAPAGWLGVIPTLGPGEMYLGFWLNFRGHWNILRQPNILSLLFALLALAGLVDTVVLPSSSGWGASMAFGK